MKKTCATLLALTLLLTMIPLGAVSVSAATCTTGHTFTDADDTVCDICNETFYQISFDGNGGTTIATIVIQPGETTSIPKVTPERSRYVFNGWSLAKNGDVDYLPGAEISAIDSSIMLYAQWNKNCTTCYGDGIEDYSEKCLDCSGKGVIVSIYKDCVYCAGKGQYKTPISTKKCTSCSGSGQAGTGSECSHCFGRGRKCASCGSASTLVLQGYGKVCANCYSTSTKTCTWCDGKGSFASDCSTCGGDGKVSEYRTVSCSYCFGTGLKTEDCRLCDGGYNPKTRSCSACNATGVVIRKSMSPPSAPTVRSCDGTVVTLRGISNGEYSIDGVNWQESRTFEELECGETYTFYQRYAKTDTTLRSSSSTGTTVIIQHMYDNDCDTLCNECGSYRRVTHTYTYACDDTCNVCGEKNVTAAHVYANACATSCSFCGAYRTITHAYTNACDADCNVCGAIRNAAHIYANDCDADCNVCGDVRDILHTYSAVCDADCNVCGDVRDILHTYSAVCDADCNVCGEERTTVGHTYINACSTSCVLCGETRSVNHTYTNDCDTSCNVCGKMRTVPHKYTNDCDTFCNMCGAYRTIKHQYTNGCDVACDVCGQTRVTTHKYTNACDDECNECGDTRVVPDHVFENGVCVVCGTQFSTKVFIVAESATATYTPMGQKTSASITASGDGLTYQWYIKNAGQTKYSKSSVTTATYTTTMSKSAKNRRLYCVVKDKYGNKVESKTFLFREAASISAESATATYTQMGKKTSVSITASGDGLTYTWYIKNEGQTRYSKSSITTATYTTAMSKSAKNRRLYCLVTDKYGNKVESKTFLLREAVSIVTQPKSVTVAKGKNTNVTVKASGDGLRYEWYIKDAGATKYTKSSITTATYATTMNATRNGRRLICYVYDKYGNKVQAVTVVIKMK